MTERQRQVRMNIAAFLLLFFVSLYRQVSLRYLPDDPFRTYILYACYLFLIGGWAISICVRVNQKSMRTFLMLEAAVMLAGLTVRFLQDTFWIENILLVRVSGLSLEATILLGLVLSIYASLEIGQWDNFRVRKSWYLLMIPVIWMAYLCLTDESRHFMFYTVPEEVQPNLNFHPYIGTFVLLGFGIVLMIVRVLLIYKRNQLADRGKILKWLIPLFEPIMVVVFSFEFFVVSLQLLPSLANFEVIELFAKIYYIEVLTWEFYIYMGLVPVNTEYREIFEHATVGMQIIGDDRYRFSSKAATEISQEQLAELKEKGRIEVEPGKELHMHKFADGLFLWNKEVSLLQNTIDELNQSAETLAQEGALLDEEIKTKNQEASLTAKNQIYDELTREVQGQLRLMKEITKKRDLADSRNAYLRELVLLGTYVKRRCNLRLIQKETSEIHEDDLRFSLEDMKSAMSLLGIQAELDWNPSKQFSAGFSIYIFDVLEYLLEYERFALKEITITAKRGKVQFLVISGAKKLPIGSIPVVAAEEYTTAYQDIPGGYLVVLSEGGE